MFTLEESIMDEQSRSTFEVVNKSLFVPQVVFDKWTKVAVVIYDMIIPVTSMMQNN